MAAGFGAKKSNDSFTGMTLTSGWSATARHEDDHGADRQLAEPASATPLGSRPSGKVRLRQRIPRKARLQPHPLPQMPIGRHQVRRDQRTAARETTTADGPELEAQPDEQQQPADRVGRLGE